MRNDYRLPIGEARTTASDKRAKVSGQRRNGTIMGVGVRSITVLYYGRMKDHQQDCCSSHQDPTLLLPLWYHRRAMFGRGRCKLRMKGFSSLGL